VAVPDPDEGAEARLDGGQQIGSEIRDASLERRREREADVRLVDLAGPDVLDAALDGGGVAREAAARRHRTDPVAALSRHRCT